jgi:glycosyltransferase involved in cell wall biosynthesis
VGDDLMADVPEDMPVARAFALDSAKHLAVKGRYLGCTAFPDRWVTWWPAGVAACLRMIRRYRPQAVWSTFPVATAHLIGLTVRRLAGLPWIAEFRDPMVQPVHRMGPVADRLWQRLEASVVRHASRCVFVTTETMADYARRYPASNASAWTVIENGYDEAVFEAAERAGPNAAARADGAVRLVHSGILYGQGRNPEPFFRALKQVMEVRSEPLEVVLRASGDEKGHAALAARLGLTERVTVAPAVGYRDAVGEMLDADGLLLFQGAVFNRQIPAKAYEYLRAGRPILALTDPAGETARLLKEWDGIYLACEDSVAEIQGALGRLLDDLAAGKVPVRRREEVRRLSRESRTAQLAAVLESTVGRSRD